MSNQDKKKYNKMENVIQYINKKFVSVSDEDAKRITPILQSVLTTITDAMKSVSPLFTYLFENFLFGGSYYDGLKVGKPDEFDLDLRLVLPKLLGATLNVSNQPGFVTVSLPGWSKFEASSEYAKYKDLAKFKDSKNYLMQDKVLQWMEGIVDKAMNKIGKVNNQAEIPVNGEVAYVSFRKAGPALTAIISYGNIKFDVDLVAVFKMTSDKWPASPFKPLPKECNGKKEFLIVPKPPKADLTDKQRYWRLSFQEQEKILISGSNTCKPALRLMKKLRDTQNHNLISSYFIKTVFLHEINKQDKTFWNSPLSFVFMHMLKSYRDYLGNYNIPYYWNEKNNLLQYINKSTIDVFKNYLTRVIDTVDKKVDENPYILREYLTTPEEQEQIEKVIMTFSKKVTKTEEFSIGDTFTAECTNSLGVDDTEAMLNECSLESNNVAVNEADTKLNVTILRMLKDLDIRMTTMHTDTSLVLQKLNSLEETVNQIKDETSVIKNVLTNLGAIKIPNTVQIQSDNRELLEQSNNIKFMLQKIDNLDKTVQDLKSENDILKTGLKQFVNSA